MCVANTYWKGVAHTSDANSIHCLMRKYHHLLSLLSKPGHLWTLWLQVPRYARNSCKYCIVRKFTVQLHTYLQLKIIQFEIWHLKFLPWMTSIVGSVQAVKKLVNLSQFQRPHWCNRELSIREIDVTENLPDHHSKHSFCKRFVYFVVLQLTSPSSCCIWKTIQPTISSSAHPCHLL